MYGIKHGWWVLICLAYMISPIDIAPELFLGPLGIADDLGVAAFALYNLMGWLKARRGARAGVTGPTKHVHAEHMPL